MKTNYKIVIDIEAETGDDSGFENSLDEAVRNIKNGCGSGFDGNDTESYSFEVTKTEE